MNNRSDSGEVRLGPGRYMRSFMTASATGIIHGNTRIWSRIWLKGFTGSSCPIILNANDEVIYPTNLNDAKHQYGVNGRFFPLSDRTERWSNQVDPSVLAQGSRLCFLHWLDPKNRLVTDLLIAAKAIKAVIEMARQLGLEDVTISG